MSGNPPIFRKRLGAELKRIRTARKFSQSQVARIIGVTQPTISRIEIGEVSIDVLGQLLELYNVEVVFKARK